MTWLAVACIVSLTAMRITVSMPSTGIVFAPGLAKPVVIELDQLPKDAANQLRELAERAGIFDRDDTLALGGSESARDYQQLTITVEQDAKRRVIQLSEPMPEISNGALREFIERVKEQARLARNPTNKKSDD
jgi:hypothetical protein